MSTSVLIDLFQLAYIPIVFERKIQYAILNGPHSHPRGMKRDSERITREKENIIMEAKAREGFKKEGW